MKSQASLEEVASRALELKQIGYESNFRIQTPIFRSSILTMIHFKRPLRTYLYVARHGKGEAWPLAQGISAVPLNALYSVGITA